jgi:hypothetical protein
LLNRYTAQKLYRGFESLPLRSAVSVKTKKNRTLLVAAALLGAVGCGGNDVTGISTYVLASSEPITVPAGFCTALNEGPVTVGNGLMNYAIDGLDVGTTMRAVIISDSFYSLPVDSGSRQCEFPTGSTKLDISLGGPQSGQIGVEADAYDFVIHCMSDADCAFSLTWSATY